MGLIDETIETHALTFLSHIISASAGVHSVAFFYACLESLKCAIDSGNNLKLFGVIFHQLRIAHSYRLELYK